MGIFYYFKEKGRFLIVLEKKNIVEFKVIVIIKVVIMLTD